MRAAKKASVDRKILQELVPLNALSQERFKEVSEKIIIEEVKSGRYLFRKGDRDNQSIYLLEGKVNLIDGFRKVASEVESGTDMSRYPISNMQPRTVSARAGKKSVIARIDSSLLDAFLTWDQSTSTEAVEIDAAETNDWMTRVLQSEAFIKIPPAMIQSLLMKMVPVEVKAGDIIIRQGDEGDYFYTIHEGRCAITRREAADADEQLLAELAEGDSFGEESLVTDTKRNASVSMLTDGMLMRLAKEDFVELMQQPLVKRVSHDTAVAMVEEGAVWVDVRTQDEYECGAFEDSVNIPLSNLRDEIPELVFNAKYVMCCDTGRRSVSAAFLLSHKGFDVYALESGIAGLEPGALDQIGLAIQSPDPDAGSQPQTDEQIAEVIDFESREVAAYPSAEAPVEPAVSATDSAGGNDAAVAELEQALETMRERNEALQAEAEQHRSSEARLTEQLELLRGELGESGEKLADLYARVKDETQEKQLLQRQHATQQQGREQQLKTLLRELAETRQQLTDLQSQADAAREQQQQLQNEVAAGEQDQQAEILQLREESAQARARAEALENDMAAAREAHAALQGESDAALQEQHERVAGLQNRLEQAERERKQLRDELAAGNDRQQSTESELRAELRERIAQADRLGGELSALQRQFDEVSGQLTEVSECSGASEERNHELTARVESLQAELDASKQQLEGQAEAAHEQQQALERQLDEINRQHQRDREQLASVSVDHTEASSTIAALQQELEQMRAGERDSELQLQEQKGRAETMAAERQAAEEALQQQQAEWEAERNRLNEVNETARQSMDELRGELTSVQEQAAAEKATLDENIQQLLDEHGEQQEQQEARIQALGQDQSRQAAELEEMQAERDTWQQQCNAEVEEKARLQQEITALRDQLAALSGSAEEHQQVLQRQLEDRQARVAELEQQGREKDVQLGSLQEELAGREAGIREAGQQQESLRRQLEAVQQELAEHDERARVVAQENQESIRKAHEDLTRKNDNEKELQGQIGRLRKKLEQATLEQQQVREAAQADVDNIREELHAERQARAEERAEMAARQRELKEQLAVVADEHETNLSKQSGAIEQARDAAREEERVRMQDLLQSQQHTEEQQQKLQQELQQAHEEIARLDQQEQERRQVSTDLLQEQNQQAEAAIEQLESQLKQLTQERDQSLEEQLELREKLNVLRAEMEAARGPGNASPEAQGGDAAQLHRELEETRNNLEIANRLRAEAENARDRLLRGRDVLRGEPGSDQEDEAALHVPSLDEEATDSGHAEPQPAVIPAPPGVSVADAEPADEAAAIALKVEDTRKPGWLGRIVGLTMVGISVFMFWLMLGIEAPQPDSGSGQEAGMEGDATPEAGLDVPGDVTPPVAEEVPEEPAARTAPVVVQQSPAVAQPVPAPVAEDKAPAAEPVTPAPAKPAAAAPTAGRAFRDNLKNGSKGPLMVELPAASYMMGSFGNSLNFDELPRHQVTLPGFSISRHEVTFAEYDRFARATRRRLPHDESWGRGRHPVINVSWHDARAYAKWLSKQTGKTYRLPTESEWEFATRAGSTETHWWGTDVAVIPANCFDCGSQWDGARTAPAGSFTANNFGLHDMAGNVQEWTEDCYHAGYAGAPPDGAARSMPQCTQRVVRGGAYSSPLDTLRSAKRGQYDQDTRLDNLGFRVVREN